MLAGGMEDHAAKLLERVREIDERIAELEKERAVTIETHDNLRRAIESLRGGRSLSQAFPPFVRSTPVRGGFPPAFPLFNAIVHVLYESAPLHRDEIVDRMSELGYRWEGKNPKRSVGNTLGRNRKIFEEVAPGRFRLRPTDRQQDGEAR